VTIGPYQLCQCYTGDALALLKQLPDDCIQCVVTSIPYWGLRDYGVDGQIGLEKSPQEFLDKIVEVFEEVRRVLRPDGTLWLNIGDCYMGSGHGWSNKADAKQFTRKAYRDKTKETYKQPVHYITSKTFGVKPKDLLGMPWRVAFALQECGWYLRSDIIWQKPNAMPESVKDRPSRDHEYIFLLTKSRRYFYDCDAIREKASEKVNTPGQNSRAFVDRNAEKLGTPQKDRRHLPGNKQNGLGVGYTMPNRWCNPKGANTRTVWSIATQPFTEAHYATFPEGLAERCILAGSRPGDIVLDPFIGSGTTGQVAEQLGRKWLGFDINPAYESIHKMRTAQCGLFTATKKEK